MPRRKPIDVDFSYNWRKTWTTIEDLVDLGPEKPGDKAEKRTVEKKEKPAQRQGDDDAAA